MEHVDVSLKKARGVLTLKPGARLEFDRWRQVIQQAGFTPRDIRFRATGVLVQEGERVWLHLPGYERPLPLAATSELLAWWQAQQDKTTPITLELRLPEGQTVPRVEGFTPP